MHFEMHVLTKIEVAAKCDLQNASGIELMKSLPHEVRITFRYSDEKIAQHYTVVFDDCESLQNSVRHAIILSKDNLLISLENVRLVEVTWMNRTKHVYLDSNDAGYDHVLTDVRFNDRSLKVSSETYSVCSCIMKDLTYIDTYVTLHTHGNK
jgi:hypothetical protein